MQEGIPNGRQIMKERLLKERKAELDKTLKNSKDYVVVVTTSFVGKFDNIEEVDGEYYATFVQQGRTDKGNIPVRRVNINQIVSTSLA